MTTTPFVYLHVRTPYGPGGGPGTAEAYARRAAALGYPALGCGDTSTPAAWAAWAAATQAADIRPIYGLALAVTSEAGEPVPLLLLAHAAAGLRNLLHLSRITHHASRTTHHA